MKRQQEKRTSKDSDRNTKRHQEKESNKDSDRFQRVIPEDITDRRTPIRIPNIRLLNTYLPKSYNKNQTQDLTHRSESHGSEHDGDFFFGYNRHKIYYSYCWMVLTIVHSMIDC